MLKEHDAVYCLKNGHKGEMGLEANTPIVEEMA